MTGFLITQKNVAFFNFQYGFRFSRSTADLLTVVSDRTARSFDRSVATRVVALDLSNALDRVWHTGLLHKRKPQEISGQVLGFISSFLSNRLLRVVLDGSLHKNIQLMLELLKAPFLVLHVSYYILMTYLLLSVILQSMLMKLISTLRVIRHLICGKNQNWLQNQNLMYETLWTGTRSGVLISMLEKLNWFHLTGLITLVLLMGTWMALFLRKNHISRC